MESPTIDRKPNSRAEKGKRTVTFEREKSSPNLEEHRYVIEEESKIHINNLLSSLKNWSHSALNKEIDLLESLNKNILDLSSVLQKTAPTKKMGTNLFDSLQKLLHLQDFLVNDQSSLENKSQILQTQINSVISITKEYINLINKKKMMKKSLYSSENSLPIVSEQGTKKEHFLDLQKQEKTDFSFSRRSDRNLVSNSKEGNFFWVKEGELWLILLEKEEYNLILDLLSKIKVIFFEGMNHEKGLLNSESFSDYSMQIFQKVSQMILRVRDFNNFKELDLHDWLYLKLNEVLTSLKQIISISNSPINESVMTIVRNNSMKIVVILQEIFERNVLNPVQYQNIIKKGVEIFNEHAQTGLHFMICQKLFSSSTDSIAHFLFHTEGLDTGGIGSTICQRSTFSKSVRKSFIALLPNNLTLLATLRIFLSKFKLPGGLKFFF